MHTHPYIYMYIYVYAFLCISFCKLEHFLQYIRVIAQEFFEKNLLVFGITMCVALV